MTDPFRYDAAPYVLGALPPEERQAFEQHAAGCLACDAAVREFAGLPGLLARLPAHEVETLNDPQPAGPAEVLPVLLTRVRRERRVARFRSAAVGLAAAAAVALFSVVVVSQGGGDEGTGRPAAQGTSQAPAPTGSELSFRAVAQTDVRATALVEGKAWGTEVTVTCTPAAGGSFGGNTDAVYTLVAVDKQGRPHTSGTWKVPNVPKIEMPASLALQREQIARLEIRDNSNRSILELEL